MDDISLPPMHPAVEAQARELLDLVIEGEPLVDVPTGFPEIDEQFRRQHERSKSLLTGLIGADTLAAVLQEACRG